MTFTNLNIPTSINTVQNYRWSEYTLTNTHTSQFQHYQPIILPQDATSPNYVTLDKDISNCIQHSRFYANKSCEHTLRNLELIQSAATKHEAQTHLES